ncbi:hypothetical protein Z517_04707 [Fonsecaea pedrosoi CBS 271.37]|uniref:Unplaced genomic scaffold supercont1.3, whole genome shotgun sequence n=1 Tax=Fonsecaea pedrosoi CBS 271.37 TaxID=1442368 RepID=A0A0D2DV15_9EURO|nr:uncharacterized protein Z517_04707 [Fonsecaea pedrosoi CBS 271.37]KIW81681.1 hypothetical protein Z517_04707 [Fonsecaea pedrosoi CBS 271.37]
MLPLKGKLAIVTGGSRGIGAAIVRSLAKRGANICFNYTSESSVSKSEKLIQQMRNEHNIDIISVKADLAEKDGPAKVVEAAGRYFANKPTSNRGGGGGDGCSLRVDIVVNNAGVCPALLLPDCTVDEFEYTYKVNVLAPLLLMQAALPYLPHDRSGRIINISSISANVGTPGQTIYGGSKAALDAMTRTWSRELAERATVVSIHAGAVLTDMVPAPFVADVVAHHNRITPLARAREGIDTPAMMAAAKGIGGRVAYDHDIAEAVAHFTLPEVGWVTGHVIGVDGGYDFIR